MNQRYLDNCADSADLFGLRYDLPSEYLEIIRYMEHRLSVDSTIADLLNDLYQAVRLWASIAPDEELMTPDTLSKILKHLQQSTGIESVPAPLKQWNACVLQKKNILSMNYGSKEWNFLAHIVSYFSQRKRWLRSWSLLEEKASIIGLSPPYRVHYRPSTGTFLLQKYDGPGRPRNGDLKSKILKVRLDEETMRRLQEYCKASQLTLVDVARAAVISFLSDKTLRHKK